MSETVLHSFPSNETEALAMLWLQSQDLRGITPEELLDKYQDAYQKIRQRNKDNRAAKKAPSNSFLY
jgi:hypothetical protein